MSGAVDSVREAARRHANETEHVVVFQSGEGWLCRVCDDDVHSVGDLWTAPEVIYPEDAS